MGVDKMKTNNTLYFPYFKTWNWENIKYLLINNTT
jgi:hypothetical protein